MNKTVPLRVRLTEEEAEMCQAAMDRLGLTERSTFVRWALANSATQVLKGHVAPRKEAVPRPQPAARPLAVPSSPPPVRAAPKPAPAPKPPPQPAPAPSLMASLGVPLYSSESRLKPAAVVESDDWT